MTPEKEKQKKKAKIEFRRDKDGNLYAVKNGKTVDKIEASGGERRP